MNLPRWTHLPLVITGLTLSFLFGMEWGRMPLQIDMLQLQLKHSGESLQATVVDLRRHKEATARGDLLTKQLADANDKIRTLSQEKRDALKNATRGTTCLGSDALRVLDGSPGLRVAGLPEAASSAARADERVATDTDVGNWAIEAGARYEQCRKRLAKLIAWHEPEQR